MACVLLIEKYFHPEGWSGAQLPRDIAAALQERWPVRVLCGSRPYVQPPPDPDPASDPRACGIRITRIPEFLPESNPLLDGLNQLLFCLAVLVLVVLRIRPRLVVTQTNPPLIVIAAALAARLLAAPLLIIAMDVYPDVLFARYPRLDTGPLASLLRSLYGWGYRQAARVVCLDAGSARAVIGKGVPPEAVCRINNWATGDLAVHRRPVNRLMEPWRVGDRFVVLYSGNLGEAHDWETAVAAFAGLSCASDRFCLLFVARGSRLAAASSQVRRHGLEQLVHVHDLVPAASLPDSLGLADLGLVTVRDGFEGLVVPSKLSGYLARGIPVLYIGPPSEFSRLLERHGAGFCYANGDAEGVRALIRALEANPRRIERCRQAALHLYDQQFAKAVGLGRYQQLAAELMG